MELVGKENDIFIMKDEQNIEEKLKCKDELKSDLISSIGESIIVKIIKGTIVEVKNK